MTTLQRYLTQNQNHYHRLWRELKTAKQLENEAKYVDSLSKVVTRTMLEAPLPDHPAASSDPIRTQYGYIPQNPYGPHPVAASAA